MAQGIIEIRGTNPDYNRFRFFINNFTGIDYNLDMSTDSMPLPQANDEYNVLTKTAGNALRISISWIIAEETGTNPAGSVGVVAGNSLADDAYSGSTPYAINKLLEADNSTPKYPSGTITTPDEQVRFLLEDFQNSGVEFRYVIDVGDTKLNKYGTIERLSIRKQGSAPVTYLGSLSFIVGDVVTITGTGA